jgi:hypothetical protein
MDLGVTIVSIGSRAQGENTCQFFFHFIKSVFKEPDREGFLAFGEVNDTKGIPRYRSGLKKCYLPLTCCNTKYK